jgi:cold-inducible RNA-binding protein
LRIYAGNLRYSMGDDDLRQLFEKFGSVQSAEVIMDRATSRSKGFGFVEMDDEEQARAAIQALNGKDVDGRSITVSEARPRRSDSGGSYSY